MSAPTMHECAAPECGRYVRRTLLMCPHHWCLVPRHIREQVLDAWSGFEVGNVTAERVRSIQAYAIASVSPRGDTVRPAAETVKGGAL